jgi:hypothetical protein
MQEEVVRAGSGSFCYVRKIDVVLKTPLSGSSEFQGIADLAAIRQ